MEFAASLYRGGELFAASKSDYDSSKELGLICPFCKESVFLARQFTRIVEGKEQIVAASWRHYKLSTNSNYCENRSLSKKGKEQLQALQNPAQRQRLHLFNRRFWEIFKHKKYIPKLPESCLHFMDEDTMIKMVRHCRERWDTKEILKSLPKLILNYQDNSSTSRLREVLKDHPAAKSIKVDADEIVEEFSNIKFSVLRHRILAEVICWLETPSAKESFTKLIQLSILDCWEVLPRPIHSTSVAHMAIISLILTDWEEAIASLKDPTKGLGFGS